MIRLLMYATTKMLNQVGFVKRCGINLVNVLVIEY
jgi:hypothetical protein